MIPEISGLKIVESSLCIKGIGVKKHGKSVVYLSKVDWQNIQNAKSQEELKSVIDGIKIIEIKDFSFL